MFTGIIESIGIVQDVKKESSNIRLSIRCSFSYELKVDQSVSHNGVCLTIVKITGDVYEVVLIDETLKRSNLGGMKTGDKVNLERCLKIGDRLDGHMVQGHVDTTAVLKKISDQNGSKLLFFEYENSSNITVEKGSITVNGISLTVVDSNENSFSVAIIPYTWENTNLKNLNVGDSANIEFDVIGKYVQKILKV